MIENIGLSPTPAPAPFRLDSMLQADLIALRQQIDEKLNLKLEKIDLSSELALQFKQAKSLYADILDDEDVAANQKAQVLNSCTTIIATITKTQTELYNAERLKKLESAMLKALKTLPLTEQEAFMDLYAGYLN